MNGRIVNRNERRSRRDISVPFLPLSGKWLGELGFQIGTKVEVECREGEITRVLVSFDGLIISAPRSQNGHTKKSRMNRSKL